ncbi:MAG: UbiA family prenyltransferase [Pseudonocardiales bacterium]
MTINRIEEPVRLNPSKKIVISKSRALLLAWREARPVVQMIFMLRFLTGAVITVGATGTIPWESVGFAAAFWLAAMITVYLVNGISDVPEDVANGSSRPIASGLLPQRTAAKVAAMTATVALVGAALVGGGWSLLCTLAMLGLGWAYSMWRKPLKRSMTGFLGTVVASGMLTYLAGWNSIDAAGMHLEFVLFGAAMSLWMGFGGATKDLSDVHGDRLAGRRTWPVMLGERRARQAMAGAAVATGAGFATASLTLAPGLLLAGSTLLVGSVLVATTALSASSRGGRNARRRPYRIFMITQYAVHLALFAQLSL